MNNFVSMKLLNSFRNLQGHQKDVSITLEGFHESVQIEGEKLLNDAQVIVLFKVMDRVHVCELEVFPFRYFCFNILNYVWGDLVFGEF